VEWAERLAPLERKGIAFFSDAIGESTRCCPVGILNPEIGALEFQGSLRQDGA